MLRGLTFLHEEIVNRDGKLIKPTIVHRDFKSRNVMLNADLVASIGDFGLALRCENGRTPQDTHGQVASRYIYAHQMSRLGRHTSLHVTGSARGGH
jgi:serine/threonine protein kinase